MQLLLSSVYIIHQQENLMLRKTLILSQSAALLLVLIATGVAVHHLAIQNREVVQSWSYMSGQVESLYEIGQLASRTEGALYVAEQGQHQMAVNTVIESQGQLDDILNDGSLAFLSGGAILTEIRSVYTAYAAEILSLIKQTKQGQDTYDASINSIPAYRMELDALVSRGVEKQHRLTDSTDNYWRQQLVSLRGDAYLLVGFAVVVWAGVSIGTWRLVPAPVRDQIELKSSKALIRYKASLSELPLTAKRLAIKSRRYYAHTHAHYFQNH